MAPARSVRQYTGPRSQVLRASASYFFLLVAAAAGAPAARAQLVQGRVVLVGSAKPVAGVPVRLLRVTPADTAPLPADTTPLAVYRTGRDGVFSLMAPDTGVYRARIGDAFVGPLLHLLSPDTLAAYEYRVQPGEARALFDFEVEKQAGMRGGLTTRYPAELQAQCVTGEVVTQFVVDTAGRADLRTLRVLQSSNPLFSQSVRNALGAAQFYPAEIHGRPVRQLVQLPVTFSIDAPGGCRPVSPFGQPRPAFPNAYPSPFPGAPP